ncbi:hypothetical protein REPUB_Repub02eG0029200 [Reevesia pubescens]
MASIPSPIIFDILVKLPIKSLARFKTLNKLCHSFIREPDFIHTHFKIGSANSANNFCLILSCKEHPDLNNIIHFLTVRADMDELAVVEYSPPVSLDSYQVLPSCNGLVCFYGLHGGVYVCNPSTKDIFRLPDFEAEGFRSLISICGFGFDETSGKYKVIKFLEPNLEAVIFDVDDLSFEIFTMGNNSWRKISYHPCFGFQHDEPPVFLGGFFYWITDDSPPEGNTSSFSIVSFDVGNEIFEAISPPENLSEKNWIHFFLLELRGELCLVDLDYELDEDRNKMDIWIFKGIIDKKEHWVKETIVHQSESIAITRPVAFKGKEILLHGFIKDSDHFNWYNLETGCFRQLKIKGIPSHYHICKASHHVESLFQVGHY